ncbi:hypothetical protein M413DRAFT_319222 [Hebeloma cylindrosporum]|uniref:Uncharacterized protein n=1 Tax=Hebeloma cylindrosporum TaxID=76867 RepID=A0A0C2XEA9_HEBCY|nr:hypothetical protein M413DRAFT_319222 [Hebeloma cylindrosporum h7]
MVRAIVPRVEFYGYDFTFRGLDLFQGRQLYLVYLQIYYLQFGYSLRYEAHTNGHQHGLVDILVRNQAIGVIVRLAVWIRIHGERCSVRRTCEGIAFITSIQSLLQILVSVCLHKRNARATGQHIIGHRVVDMVYCSPNLVSSGLK